MAKYQCKPDGVRYHASFGRIMEKKGSSLRIHWSTFMLDYLKKHFPTTLNEELSGCIGVSVRTMLRKARELGLKKDPNWLAEVREERRRWALSASRRLGYPGGFKKGVRNNPSGEYKKGRQRPEEELAKASESLKRWYKLHPKKAKDKARKTWATRINNSNKLKNNESS